MEAVIENLTKEEFFGFGPYHSENLNPSFGQDFFRMGNIIFWMIIGGVIVYVFREDIEALIQRLSGKSTVKSG